MPEPPATLHVAGRAAWNHAERVLDSIGEDPALSRGAILRYAEACEVVAVLRAAWDADERPAIAPGSRKQPTMHPLVEGIRDAEKHAQALGVALLLTPEARWKATHARGGRPGGTSQAPDRSRVSVW